MNFLLVFVLILNFSLEQGYDKNMAPKNVSVGFQPYLYEILKVI